MAKTATTIRFTATLLRPAAEKSATWTFLKLPKDASDQLPSRSKTSVEGAFNGVPFQATLEPDGQGGHWLKVELLLRQNASAKAGDEVSLEISPMEQEPEPDVPEDLQKALAEAPKARDVWLKTTPLARRDWIQWITSGKKAETRAIRVEKATSMLATGKKRPCCFDRSGMYSKSITCPIEDTSQA